MYAAIVCREYGWTWEQFLDQPKSFIDTIFSMLQNESQVAEMKNSQK